MPWHPMAVHFPIALLLSGLAVDVAALLGRRPAWHGVAYGLLVAGTLGAAIAAITGNAAAAAYRESDVAGLVQEHEGCGSLVLIVFLAIALGRLPLVLRQRTGWPWLHLWIAAAAVGAVLLVVTSLRGGRLVFEHGVGVRAAPPQTVGPDLSAPHPPEAGARSSGPGRRPGPR